MNQTNTIANYSNGKNNNFDIIRFIAASLVVFSHSFPLSLASGNKFEPLYFLSDGQSALGRVAVFVFFVTSGFLITQSYDRSKNLAKFLRARILRIFPALIVVVILTTFVLGPLLTTLTIREYFTNQQTYSYLPTMFLLIKYHLPGVFEDNIYGGAINGSLWTLKFEFFFYLVVATLGYFKLLKKEIIFLIFLSTLILSFTNITLGEKYIEMFLYFSAGMVLYLYRDFVKLDMRIVNIFLFILFISIFLGGFEKAFGIFGSYLIMILAFSQKFKFPNFSKHGDFSYGIYIYAFPIQQLITYSFGHTMNPILNFLIAFPITLVFAVLSWRLIEKRALNFKNYSFIKYKSNNKHAA
ncbi:acyltransferase [Neobacillus niacini]|uniref:acyltransferase family protein n=1 Tax=Neobacillus niacini TaxID=86668 RepID=UPI0007AB6B7C|nr:acyltransferase [Neobacillus niacini]MEC1524807.1 acyltransferase [Neobacillus niacini]